VARRSLGGQPEIVVLDATTGSAKRLTLGRDPSWHPKGDWIAYLPANHAGKALLEIRAIKSDGSGDRRVTVIGETNEQRRHFSGPLLWSENGEKIAASLAEQLWILSAGDSASGPIRVRD
jgi:Tol biopolymer transport system component